MALWGAFWRLSGRLLGVELRGLGAEVRRGGRVVLAQSFFFFWGGGGGGGVGG